MMSFIGWDSNQTHWFISYRFRIRTITGVTLHIPHWRGSCLYQLIPDMGQALQLGRDYDASVLQGSFSEMGCGQFNKNRIRKNWHDKSHTSPFEALPIWMFFMLPLKTLSISWYRTFFWDTSLRTYYVIFWSSAHLVKQVIFRDGSVMASHSGG